jgi:hypothetical protein
MTAPNATLAYKVLDHIDAHPENWNQAHWWCGTSGCFAGWTVQLSGETPDEQQCIDGVHISHRAAQLLGFADEIAMNEFAYRLIGTGGGWELFCGGNDREDLGWIVKAMFGPRPESTPVDHDPETARRIVWESMGMGHALPPVDDVPPNAGSAS